MKLKRIIAIILCFAMVFSTMSFSVFAEGTTIKGGTFENLTQTQYVADDYELDENGNVVATPAPAAHVYIGTQGYETLQAAIDVAEPAGGEVTITLADNITENVTINEKVGLYLTIEGADKTMNGNITIKALSDTNDNRRITINNVNFVNTSDTGVDFITSNETNHYPRLTVANCDFTGNGKDTDVAIRTKSAYDLIIEDCTGEGLHSFLQNTAGVKVTIERVTVTESKGGLAMGTAQNVTIRNCNLTTRTYGIRLDAVLDTTATLNGNTVNAYIPVSVRKATATEYKLNFNGTQTMTATNADGVWCAICGTEYEDGFALNAPTGNVKIAFNSTNLTDDGIYGEFEYPVVAVYSDGYSKGFDTLTAAMNHGYSGGEQVKIVVNKNITESMTALNGNIVTENPNGVTIKNTIVDEWIYCSENFTIGEGVTYDASGYASGLFMYAENAVINGTVITDCYYQRYENTKLTINEPGSMTVKTETFILRYTDNDGEAGVYVVGDNDDTTIGLNAAVIYFYQGMINAKDADIKVGTYWQTQGTDGAGTANLVLDNSNMVVTVNEHNFKATGNSTVTLTNGSTLTCAGGFEATEGGVSVDATSKITAKGEELEFATYVASVNGTKYEKLEEAFKAVTAENNVIEILADVTVDYLWNCRSGNGAQFTVPVTINGNNKTIKFTGEVKDNNWNTIFRFEENAAVNDLAIDISEATGTQRVITAKKSLDVDNLTIVGSAKYGIIFGEGASAADLADAEISITNSNLNGTRRAISDNENGKDVKSVTVTGNDLNGANVYLSAFKSITFNNNTAAGEVDLRAYTANNTLDVTATGNALNTEKKNYIDAGGTVDAQPEFVIKARGSNSPAYTKEVDGYVRVWGEGGGNAKESFVLKLYSQDTLMATTQLNNVGGILNGNVHVTWNFYYPESNDEYWTTTWEEGHPCVDAQPTKVELYIDGTLVATTDAQMNGADGINPVVWSELGGVAPVASSYVAKIGDVGYASLQAAVDEAQNNDTIVLMADIKLTNPVKISDKSITLDLGAYTIEDKSTEVITSNDDIWGLIALENNARLTICGTGTIKCNYTNVANGWTGMAYCVDVDKTSLLTVNGGKFINGNGGIQTQGTVTINDGTFVSHNGGACIMALYSDAIVTVNDGTFKDSVVAEDVYTGSGAVWSGFGATVTINGGTYDFSADPEHGNVVWTLFPAQNVIAGLGNSNNSNMTVKGGTFVNFNPAKDAVIDYSASEGFTFGSVVDDGYSVAKNQDGTFSVGTMPNAEVKNLGAITIDEYTIWNGSFSEGGDPIDLQVAMEFIAKDTEAEAEANVFGNYTTDFFIEIDGIKDGKFIADGCYLAGNYGEWGWIMIPIDGMEIIEGKVYPVITSVGFDFKYVDICTSVKDFKCGIYFTEDILKANPDMSVTLTLGLSETREKALETEFITVDEPYTYTVEDMLPKKDHGIFGIGFYVVNMDPVYDDTYRIGLFAGIDSLRYKEVGFKVYDGDTLIGNGSTKYVYKKITAGNGSLVAEEQGVYRFFGIPVDFPTTYDNKNTLKFQPYAIDLSGKEITGLMYDIYDIHLDN